jgi:hypothetical protein
VIDPQQIRALLGDAPGYAVIDRHGKRIGAFAGLAGGDRIAIRHDGVFVWHRRLLPIAAVARVIEDQRAVVLRVDERVLSEAEALLAPASARSDIAKEDPNHGGVCQSISPYVEPVEGDGHEAERSREEPENEPSPHAIDKGSIAPRPDQLPHEPDARDERSGERHLLFLSSVSSGYSLLEREGPPPAVGHRVEVPEQSTPFAVLKLGTSPLPNDDRICAYLEPAT